MPVCVNKLCKKVKAQHSLRAYVHIATISVWVRRFDRKVIVSFVTNEITKTFVFETSYSH